MRRKRRHAVIYGCIAFQHFATLRLNNYCATMNGTYNDIIYHYETMICVYPCVSSYRTTDPGELGNRSPFALFLSLDRGPGKTCQNRRVSSPAPL